MDKHGVIKYLDGKVFFEGSLDEDGVPRGWGITYYPDGTKYQEGLFGKKGLLWGKEYYPSGNVRFDGSFVYNQGYGPNYPIYGAFYSEDGKEVFAGTFKIRRSGLGWPFVVEPETYGNVVQDSAPKKPLYNRDEEGEKSMEEENDN